MNFDTIEYSTAEINCFNKIGIHKNIIGFIEDDRAVYHQSSGGSKMVKFIVLELAARGELFHLL